MGRPKRLTPEQIKENRILLNKKWIAENRERYNASKYLYRDRLKYLVLSYYSDGKPICAYCGDKDIDVLVIDHINNDGAEWRRKLKVSGRGNNSGSNTYQAIKREGFPTGLQVLCANCNTKKEVLRKREKRMKNPFYKEKISDAN